jgi:hypothetical protein
MQRSPSWGENRRESRGESRRESRREYSQISGKRLISLDSCYAYCTPLMIYILVCQRPVLCFLVTFLDLNFCFQHRMINEATALCRHCAGSSKPPTAANSAPHRTRSSRSTPSAPKTSRRGSTSHPEACSPRTPRSRFGSFSVCAFS